MKTKSDMKPFIIAALSLTLLVGCGNDDFPAEEPKVPLEITSAFVTGDVQTRAVTPELLTSGSIGVFLEGRSGTGYDKKDNIQYDYNVGWKPKTDRTVSGRLPMEKLRRSFSLASETTGNAGGGIP